MVYLVAPLGRVIWDDDMRDPLIIGVQRGLGAVDHGLPVHR